MLNLSSLYKIEFEIADAHKILILNRKEKKSFPPITRQLSGRALRSIWYDRFGGKGMGGNIFVI